MSVKIRLQRFGAHKKPFYRIVTIFSRNKRNGKFLEIVGTYNPFNHEINVNYDKISKWLKYGAQPTATVVNLLKKSKKLKNKI